ncbi:MULTISPECIES: hypothetical protein [unclassified Streptomyces]|uniref:hypothetical protein n=1 Tax=unclassified Streptomyces TaxID=2593676 RepID=UPI000DD7AE6D|nr:MULTISPECIES: hypothetical protein [unclassified Streptomyces]QZZ29897.1 hypothetical protein A7X85_29925 [Streptomyces sp. ST1015]
MASTRDVACAVTMAVGLLVTGCSTNSEVRAADVTLSPPPTGYDGLMRLPLSAYGTSKKDDDLLFTAQKALVVRCMKSEGHKNYAGENINRITAKTAEEKEAANPVGAWGYIGRATAKRRGFHTGLVLPTGGTGVIGQAAKDYEACAIKAKKQLPDLTKTDGWKLTQTLYGQSLRLAFADRRVIGARERWSTCITAAGHPAQDPEKLAASPWNPAKPTAKEIAAAVAAESCTRSSDLAAVYFTVLTGYQQQLISANTEALTRYQRQVREQTDQASELAALDGFQE